MYRQNNKNSLVLPGLRVDATITSHVQCIA